jgi:hypothetical protein
MGEFAWVMFAGLLVVGLVVLYGRLIDSKNKGGRVDLLEQKLKATKDLLRKKNAYIATLEKSLLDTASAELVVDALNGMFEDEDSLSAGTDVHSDGVPREAIADMDGSTGFKSTAVD